MSTQRKPANRDVWSGVAARGPWSGEKLRAHLDRSRIPLRLALVTAGGPWTVSLWFAPDESGLWIATRRSSFVARMLSAHPACGFEIAADAPPYRGLRGTGEARPEPDRAAALLERLMRRYSIRAESELARSLRRNAHEETAFCIVPHRVATWDFSERMADALEPSGATR